MTAALGQIVLYTLNESDAYYANRSREIDSPPELTGNRVHAGTAYPAIVVAHSESGRCNLQVFLDGNDTLWVTGVVEEFGRLSGPGFYTEDL